MRDVYVCFDNDDAAHAAKNDFELKEMPAYGNRMETVFHKKTGLKTMSFVVRMIAFVGLKAGIAAIANLIIKATIDQKVSERRQQ